MDNNSAQFSIEEFRIMNPEKMIEVIALFLLLSLPVQTCSTIQHTTEYTTRNGLSFSVTESHPSGQSLSDINVVSRGFAYDISQTYRDCDPIDKIFLADLDRNGFEELYIITRSSGSGSYGDLLGFASNRDISLSPIHLPRIAQEDNRFAGYMGHDTFEVAGHKLLRTFPIYLPTDHNGKPTGGMRTVQYGLDTGEGTWQLRIESISQAQ
ncbi:MAG: hypothetical protein ACWGOX_13500 [Desulforhopalus sp.]